MKLHLRKFDVASIPDDKVILLIAKRGSGKSICIKDLMYYHRDIPIGAVISPTEAKNRFYSDFVPSLFIHHEYSPELVQNIVNRQTMIMKKRNKEISMYSKSSIDPRAFFIMDDCMFDNDWKKDKNIRYIFSNGRHDKILMIITLQYVIGIPPDMRSNVDYVFLFRENNYQNRKKLYDQYCGMFPTFELFCRTLDVVTEGYGCLVIDNTSRSNKLEDMVFWYQADMHDEFLLGSKDMWEMHNQLLQDDGELSDGEEPFDMANYNKMKKKNHIPINIKKVT